MKVTQDGYDRLVIEAIGHRCISVVHYFEQNGDLIADLEVVFFRDHAGNWIAIETTMVMIGTRRYVEPGKVKGNDGVVALNARMQADLARFTDIWAKNIRGARLGADGTARAGRDEVRAGVE